MVETIVTMMPMITENRMSTVLLKEGTLINSTKYLNILTDRY